MAKFTRNQRRFDCLGVCLTRAIDNLLDVKFPILKNVRSYQQGVIQARPGETAYNASAIVDNLLVHSIKRLNNDIASASQAFAIILGVGTSIYSDSGTHNSFISRASGFSGVPLSLVPFRPNESPEPYLYIMDTLKSGKLKVDGSFSNMGIAASSTPPTVILGRQRISPFHSLSQGVANGWAVGGTGSVTSVAQSRTNTTITRILYDDPILATSDWVSIQPASFQEINVGSRPTLNTGQANVEVVLVEQVFEPAHTTTIAAIAYDSGTTGLCSIVLTATSKVGLRKDASLVLDTEMVRILDIKEGPNDSISIRASTTINHTVGQVVTGIATFRASGIVNSNHVATETITQTDHRLSITTGIGTYSNPTNIDASFIGTRPLTSKDWVHIAIKIDDPSLLVEGKLLFNVDDTVGDFTKNYYYFAFNANDFTPAVNDDITTLTARQKKLQNNLIDAQIANDPIRIANIERRLSGTAKRLRKLNDLATTPPLGVGPATAARFETVAGASQWTEFFVRLSEEHLTRVGGDTSKSLANINDVRIQFNVSGTTTVDVCDFYFAGTYGAEISSIGTPYTYTYRYRSSTTGAKSAWSPILRTGITPRRQLVNLTPIVSGDSQADKIDWARFGGTRNQWIKIGTQPNSGTFDDELSDLAIIGFEEADLTEGYQPFPTIDLPKSSTVTVVGSTITRTAGDAFNTNWIPGVPVIINSQLCTLYRVLSGTVLEIVENAGSQVGVSCFIPAPEIAATLLSSMWGPFVHEGEIGSVMFACGDSNNSGTLYWTNPDNPDLARDTNYLEVTSPSEPLVNGFVYDSRAWVFSSEDLFQIYPSQDINGRLTFRATRTGLGLGLAGRYFFCTTEGMIIFGSKDGIYITNGSSPQSITDDDLYPLFPHDGQVGITINGFIPPDYSQPLKLRLSAGGSEIRFDYLGTDSNSYTLVYNMLTKSWWPDTYSKPIVTSYWEEIGKSTGNGRWLLGSNNGKLYVNSGTSDDGDAIACQVRTLSDNGGDFRTKKKMGDALIDYDPVGATITTQLGFDRYSSLPASIPLVTTSGRRQQVLDINNGLWTYAQDLAIDLSWNSSSVVPKLFGYEFTGIQTEEDTLKRAGDADNLGTELPKFIHGFYLRANTYNVAKSFKIQSDTGTNGAWQDQETFSITSDGESVQEFSFATPFITHLIRVVGVDTDPWSLIDYQFIWEPDSPLTTTWISQVFTQGLSGYQHIKDGYISHISTTNLLVVRVIDGVAQTAITVPNSGGIFLKSYIIFPAKKFKTIQYKITSASGFRLYKSACEIRAKQWASVEEYQVLTPFGEQHYTEGPRI